MRLSNRGKGKKSAVDLPLASTFFSFSRTARKEDAEALFSQLIPFDSQVVVEDDCVGHRIEKLIYCLIYLEEGRVDFHCRLFFYVVNTFSSFHFVIHISIIINHYIR